MFTVQVKIVLLLQFGAFPQEKPKGSFDVRVMIILSLKKIFHVKKTSKNKKNTQLPPLLVE